jgi:CRISPR-associated protein Csd1
MQKACETYDAHIKLVGKPQERQDPLVPVSHSITSAKIEITVNQDGKFVSARAVDKSEPKIIFPVTENSGGRTSGLCAHPLCDQLGYIAPYDEKKHSLYANQLTNWTKSEYSHPMLLPILTYVQRESILDDLKQAGLVHLDENGLPKPEEEKAMICWRVVGIPGLEEEACWLNQDLFRAYIAWYTEQQQGREKNLCMISGDFSEPASQHPKGIVPNYGNAKLLSANDTSGYTYLGRFTNASQAATVSYLSSQKAHNTLRWLIANQGVPIGGRIFLCWNPQGKAIPQVASPLRKKDATPAFIPTDYQKQLRLALESYQSELPEDKNGVVVAVFDAATTGRLSLTYYNELRGSDFLQRLHDWDMTCCWYNGVYGIQSPPLKKIVQCAFGNQRDEKLEIDDRVLKQQFQRLMACRLEQSKFPYDIEQAVVKKASNLQIYEDDTRKQLLFVACAIIKKYRYDTFKEEWKMSLEPSKQDRSYQFGRLLAVLEKVEQDAYKTYKDDEKRETNAMRMQAVFSQRPQYASRILWERLEPYFRHLSTASRNYYNRLVGEIEEQLSQFPESERNDPLKDTYMLGYYLQRNALYQSNKEQKTEEK